MSDLISRQQPVARDTNVLSNDTIYRQAAIDALADMHCKSDEDGYVWIIRSDAWARIDALPSTEPEIIRCKECKHFHYDMPYVIQGVPVLGHEVCDAWGDGCKTDENGYCFLAERRTDEHSG